MKTFLVGIVFALSLSSATDTWEKFLSTYLDTTHADGVYRVRYASVTAKDKLALDAYLLTLQQKKVSTLSRPVQLAFWINLYNAGTVAEILRHYPLQSIRDIQIPGFKSQGPWDKPLFTIEGKKLSLNDIENKIVRPIWKDPRVHFAFNCASLGCPNLAAKPYHATTLDKQLNRSAQNFINSSHGATLTKNSLQLSKLFEWYRSDFAKSDLELISFLATYAKPSMRDSLKNYTGKITYVYDWALNQANNKE